jgi:hypothetical protein
MSIHTYFANNPRNLFLLDGFGALVSAIFLFIIYAFESYFGMPRSVMQFLIALPCLYAVYSFACYFLIGRHWRLGLKVIALANLSYCILTALMVNKHQAQLTFLGDAYFVSEMIVLLVLVWIELRAAFSKRTGS